MGTPLRARPHLRSKNISDGREPGPLSKSILRSEACLQPFKLADEVRVTQYLQTGDYHFSVSQKVRWGAQRMLGRWTSFVSQEKTEQRSALSDSAAAGYRISCSQARDSVDKGQLHVKLKVESGSHSDRFWYFEAAKNDLPLAAALSTKQSTEASRYSLDSHSAALCDRRSGERGAARRWYSP